MFNQTGIFLFVTFATLVLSSIRANSETLQQGTQDAYIKGDDNEINQTINQYYFNNPGKGAINRRDHITEQQRMGSSSR